MKQQIFFLFLPVLLFFSCSSDSDNLLPEPPSGQLRFEISFAGDSNGLQSRASTVADFKTTWNSDDKVGLYIVKGSGGLQSSGNWVDNLEMTYNGSTWSYTLPSGKEYYPNDGDELHFYAYHPYDASMLDATSYTFSVQSDQRGDTNGKSHYDLSDLLTAKTENVLKSSSAVSLQFSHALSLIQVEVKREVNVPHFSDTDFTVTLTNALPDALLGWGSAPIGSGSPTDIVMRRVDDMPGYTYRALVPAQTFGTDTRVTFTQTTADKEIDMEYQGVKSILLTAGATHKHSVTLGWGINPDHEYAVGDVYPHVGPVLGLVYWVNPNDSRHGKVVGLQENSSVQWADNENRTVLTYVNDMSNGLVNMHTMSEFIFSESKSWSNFPVFQWVHDMNSPSEDYSNSNATGVWYLPAYNELWNSDSSSLYEAFTDVSATTFNNKLTAAGGTALDNSGWSPYWSSSEYDFLSAWVVFFNGVDGLDFKFSQGRARCVLAF